MRNLALALLAVGGLALAISTPAKAQAYDPRYPVCLKTYGSIEGDMTDCSYMTLAQCNTSASGRAAQCLTNPYFANGSQGTPRSGRRHRRHDS